jgi:hypothetical protein
MATEAWLAGDIEEVRLLIEGWYATTRAAGQRALENKELVTHLRRRLSDLESRYGPSNILHPTA